MVDKHLDKKRSDLLSQIGSGKKFLATCYSPAPK